MTFSVTTPSKGVCENCGSETELVGDRCYLCERLYWKERNVRVGGAVLTVLGLIVIGLMSVIIYSVNQSAAGSRNNGSARNTALILLILNSVLGYGIASLVAGIWHFVTGRVNKILLYAVYGIGTALVFVSLIISAGN